MAKELSELLDEAEDFMTNNEEPEVWVEPLAELVVKIGREVVKLQNQIWKLRQVGPPHNY